MNSNHQTRKGQQALQKISSFASLISESYNQDDAGEIQDIMELASQMGNSLKTHDDVDDAWNIFLNLCILNYSKTVNRRNLWLQRIFLERLTSSIINLVRSYAKVTFLRFKLWLSPLKNTAWRTMMRFEQTVFKIRSYKLSLVIKSLWLKLVDPLASNVNHVDKNIVSNNDNHFSFTIKIGGFVNFYGINYIVHMLINFYCSVNITLILHYSTNALVSEMAFHDI